MMQAGNSEPASLLFLRQYDAAIKLYRAYKDLASVFHFDFAQLSETLPCHDERGFEAKAELLRNELEVFS
jgi:hypothetical protein